jgi:hypothetical protein
MEYVWKNALLYSKRAGTFDRGDLDAYDSELAHDLYTIHDDILNNPVRDYDPMNPYSVKRYFNYTFNAVSNKLVPAIEKASETLIGREGYVDSQIRTAEAELRKAERWAETEDYDTASAHLETAFSTLHVALDRLRYATRQVPKVRSLRPVPAMMRAHMEKVAWQVGKSVDSNGDRIHGYLWIDQDGSDFSGLVISDKYKSHRDLADAEGIDRLSGSRGVIVLNPDKKVGDVFMYEDGTHSDADFIPNDIWREIQSNFKDYKLEEKQGLSSSLSSGGFDRLPTPVNRNPVYASGAR